MAPEVCLPHVQACAMRVTTLFGPGTTHDGVPKPGSDTMYVSDALVSLQFAWEVQEGDSITEKNACGATVLDYKAPDSVTRGNVTINLVTPDPRLSAILSDITLLTSGSAVGNAAPALGEISEDNPISIELWAKRILDGRLDPDFPYARWVYPYLNKVRPGDHEHGNANLATSFTAQAFENAHWFDGPLNDWPVASDRVWQWLPVTSKPSAACSYLTVSAT